MVKPAVVIVLVAGLLLAAFPDALAVEIPSPSIAVDENPSSHPQISNALRATDLDCVEESEVSEVDASEIFLDGGRRLEHIVPAFHRRATHAINAHRSREPAVIHGRSPPC